MAVSKQGGVKNYLGNQKMVKAPLHWQSAPDHPKTELAYITDAEKKLLIKKDLHKSLKGGVNRGPSGIMSLNGWGSSDPSENRAGADISASMDTASDDPGWSAPGGYTSPAAKSPAELKILADQAGSSTVMPESFYGRTYQDRSGSGLGALLRGALGLFGGIPGRLMSGIMTAKDWAQRQGSNLKEGFEEFKEHDNFLSWLNRNKGMDTNTIEDPDLETDQMKEFQMKYPLDLANANAANTQAVNQDFNLPPEATNYLERRGILFNKGGRVGLYQGGGGGFTPVMDSPQDDPLITPFQIQQEEGVPMGLQASDDVNTRILENLFEKYIDLGFSPAEAEKLALSEFESMAQGGDMMNEEGLASLV